MIRTETEYQEAVRRRQQDIIIADAQRKNFLEYGLTSEEIERAMQPILSFQAQLCEEIEWYEEVCRGNFAPSERLSNFGRMLIACRLSRGMTQKQLADKLGVKESSVSRDERNEYHGITLDRANRVLQALGYSAKTVLEDMRDHDAHAADGSRDSVDTAVLPVR